MIVVSPFTDSGASTARDARGAWLHGGLAAKGAWRGPLSAQVLSDKLGEAVLVFEGDGSVAWASRAAVRLIDASGQVRLRQGPGGRIRLSCGSGAETARLDSAFALRRDETVGLLLDGASRLLLRLLPADDAYRIGRLLCTADCPQAAWLADAFGLTAAEARALDALARFDRGADAAACLGISQHTLKDHLAAIYAKTGCDRKAQLFRLLGLAHG